MADARGLLVLLIISHVHSFSAARPPRVLDARRFRAHPDDQERMTWIVRVALERPLTFIVMALLVLIFGPLAASRMAVDIFPDIRVPVIGVAFQYSGLWPRDQAEPENLSGGVSSMRSPPAFGCNNRRGRQPKIARPNSACSQSGFVAGLWRSAIFIAGWSTEQVGNCGSSSSRLYGTKRACAPDAAGSTRNHRRNYS